VPVLLVQDGIAREIEPPGYRLPLGAEDDGAYEDAKVELRPGDTVVFSSDGLVEAPALRRATPSGHLPAAGYSGELFGFERLSACVTHWSGNASSAEAIAAGIWSDLTAWCGEESHHDDMTLLVLRVPSRP
jgi:sigma-B regulation protein RsbU (phosphoserine phosphatase)